MSKGLEALAYLMERQNNLEKYGSSGEFSISKLRLCLDAIEKELKALEIIKENKVNVGNLQYWFSCHCNDTYNDYLLDRSQEHWFIHFEDNEETDYTLTQEEFNLLKEVLL